ncbi:hypothetical protein [Devosia faecipullorum]|uniref:hypothetical protein n=1 Tax=Devosia faecipullorum TaxID=2755039 RepID=UPI00187BC185|nr:hypothetical protein [Devosia faecipullorum]MBE7734551.1 hypothetical protein [Devosia faecipullorum]
MSNGYSLGAAGLRIWNGTREVFNTAAGRLVNFLPSASTYTFTAGFPDALKGKIGFWYWESRWTLPHPEAPNRYGYHVLGAAAVGARPQKWTNIIVLGDAPPGANMFIGQARLTRTQALHIAGRVSRSQLRPMSDFGCR